MATGTVQFQFGTIASPPPGLAVMADAVNHSTLGAGTAQFIKIMTGAVGGTAGVEATEANGLEVDVTRVQGTIQALGSVQGVGTFQVLGSVQGVGTFQALGTFQPHGTVQALGSFQAVGTTQTKEIRSTAPTTTSVAATVGNIILLAANPSRLGAAFFLDGGSALYLKLGSLAGTFDYTAQLTQAFGYYEVPYNYVGTVSGIWAFAGGTARITELT